MDPKQNPSQTPTDDTLPPTDKQKAADGELVVPHESDVDTNPATTSDNDTAFDPAATQPAADTDISAQPPVEPAADQFGIPTTQDSQLPVEPTPPAEQSPTPSPIEDPTQFATPPAPQPGPEQPFQLTDPAAGPGVTPAAPIDPSAPAPAMPSVDPTVPVPTGAEHKNRAGMIVFLVGIVVIVAAVAIYVATM